MDVRAAVIRWARWGVDHHGQFNYTENGLPADGPVRQMVLGTKPGQLPIYTDCSGAVTLWYKWAGAADPNGLGYRVLGYTGTLLGHGEHIPLTEVVPGDVIVYGPGTGEHTALVVEGGFDPLTVSHGQQGDPSYVYVSEDGREPQTYLRFSTVDILPPPKPPEVFPKGAPDAAALAAAHLVPVDQDQASQAIYHGWALWYFAEGHVPPFVAVEGAPPQTQLYADIAWNTERVI